MTVKIDASSYEWDKFDSQLPNMVTDCLKKLGLDQKYKFNWGLSDLSETYNVPEICLRSKTLFFETSFAVCLIHHSKYGDFILSISSFIEKTKDIIEDMKRVAEYFDKMFGDKMKVELRY